MGKCLGKTGVQPRRRSSSSSSVEVAAYLTLRSGRRVPAASGGSPRRRHHRRGGRRCCGEPGGAASSPARQRRRRRVLAAASSSQDGKEEGEESTPGVVVVPDEGCSVRHATATPVSGEATSTKRGRHDAAVAAPPAEVEMEAFFAAAELAERRRFAETYNYDITLDRPLEGRFEWSPANST